MKNLLLITIAFSISATAYAQNGEKNLKMASRSLNKYLKDPFANTAELQDARTYLMSAFEDEQIKSKPKSWLTRGEILYNIGDSEIKNKLLNPDFPISDPNVAVMALESYFKALEIAQKKGEKRDALEGIQNSENLLNNIGIEMYKSENFDASFANFKSELKAYDILTKEGETSRLNTPELFMEIMYFAGLTGYYAKEYEASIDYLLKAKEGGRNEATLYQLVYEAHRSLDRTDDGLIFLQEGRTAFPDDAGLLFSEINYFLTKGELNKMIGRLEEALEKEPDNISVIVTLGQVYDQMQVTATEEGNIEKSDEYFNKALGYYTAALDTKPDEFDLNYSLAALYYNRAAGLTPALNETANDFSPAGTKKYDSIKEEMAGFFDSALPYFLRADEISSEDRNTLIALKEIYARKDEFEKSNSYKIRLESLPD